MHVSVKAKRVGNQRRRARSAASEPYTRDDWLNAARLELIASGIDAVKVNRLTKRLHVSRGSFYWHFSSRAELLQELLKLWEHTNTVSFERVLKNGAADAGPKELIAIANLWVGETDFSPAFDTAIRNWARTSREAAAAVRRVDDRRIQVLHRIFKDLGFVDPEALVRARIMYFHQIGYYTLEIREDHERRLALVPVYLQVLSGLPASEVAILMSNSSPPDARPMHPAVSRR